MFSWSKSNRTLHRLTVGCNVTSACHDSIKGGIVRLRQHGTDARPARPNVRERGSRVNDADGVPATFALEFCKRNRFTCYVVWNNTLVAKHEPEKRAHVHACALTIVGGHAVVHKCAKSFAHMKVGEVAPLPEKTR